MNHSVAWLLVLAWLMCSCSAVNLSRDFDKTLPRSSSNESQPLRITQLTDLSVEDQARVSHFKLVADQVRGADPMFGPETRGPLPPEIAKEPVIKALVAALGKAIVVPRDGQLVAIDWGLDEPSLDASDGKTFALALKNVLNPDRTAAKFQRRALQSGATDFWKPLGQYLDAYVRGEYFDNLGATVAKPVLNNGIGNDSIVGVETVFLEFFADWILRTPLLTDAHGDYLNPKKRKPTAATVGTRPTKKLSEVNLTEKQVRAIQCACSLAGDGGLALAGVTVRSFGGIAGGPIVILGKYSIGDNQTASKVLETVFEVVFRSGTESLLYSLLTRSGIYSQSAGTDFSCLFDLL